MNILHKRSRALNLLLCTLSRVRILTGTAPRKSLLVEACAGNMIIISGRIAWSYPSIYSTIRCQTGERWSVLASRDVGNGAESSHDAEARGEHVKICLAVYFLTFYTTPMEQYCSSQRRQARRRPSRSLWSAYAPACPCLPRDIWLYSWFDGRCRYENGYLKFDILWIKTWLVRLKMDEGSDCKRINPLLYNFV